MPQFIIPTIALPPAFYALFALALGQGSAAAATHTLATFGVFAVMGPALFGFGVNIAAERETGQLELKRLSPMPAGAQISAKIAATTVYCAIALMILYLLGVVAGVSLTPGQWALTLLVHLLSIIPFSLVGMGIGYRFGQGAAVALANIVFLSLAVMGGLWFPITAMPQVMQSAAWVLPSYHLGEIALMAAGQRNDSFLLLHAGPLLLITLAAAIYAWTGERQQSR
ncbi:MAG: ABC transporter permease [Erythrobacter sp.]|nr:ABC transporter permease [Erythrobacter sp.]